MFLEICPVLFASHMSETTDSCKLCDISFLVSSDADSLSVSSEPQFTYSIFWGIPPKLTSLLYLRKEKTAVLALLPQNVG